MATVLASHRCVRHHFEPSDIGREKHDISFSGSMSNIKFVKLDTSLTDSRVTMGLSRFMAEVRPAESDKLGSNERVIKMAPTKEALKSKILSPQNARSVNGSKEAANGSKVAINGSKVSVNGLKLGVNGAKLVKRDGPSTTALVKTHENNTSEDFSFSEELNILPSDEGFSWAKNDYNLWQRTVDIWSFVISLRIRVMFDNAKWAYPGGFTEEKQKERRKKTASWLREQVLQLGPTFIKVGQLSSTRSDLFPIEFVDELAKLQDRVPAFSPEKARASIQNELGAPVDVLFKKFEDRPIAAASLGQVHRAILHSGEKVAVKIQRPGLKKLFDIDLRNLKLIAEYFQRSETFGGPTRDWLGIYDECSKILYQEIDYINEGKNADRFRRDFRNIKWIRVPLIIWDYSSTKVLTLEYVPGIKINSLNQIDARGFSRSQIASRAIEAYLIQILKTGFFHADPHPGNLAIDRDGSLIYYDFGMMGEIKSFTRERLLDLFYAVYEKDPDKVLRRLIELEALQPTGDLSSVRRSVKFFLDNLLSQSPDQEQTLAAIGEDLLVLKQKQPGGTELVDEIRRQAIDARNYTISMPYRVQRIEEFVKQLESGDLKLRVRVLESERAARKATILQMATVYTAFSGTLLNVGVTLSSQGNQVIANGSFIGAGVFLILLIRSMQRVKMLDKFEKMI